MRLSQAISQYVAMKLVMGISYNDGTKVLRSFSSHLGDVSLRSVAKWQVVGFLERSMLSDVTWLVKYRTLKAFFQYWMARSECRGLPMPPSRRPVVARMFLPYIYSVQELQQLLQKAALRHRPSLRDFGPVTFRTILLFLYGTGSRINEALSLKIEDVDLKQRTVTFHRPVPSRTRTIPIGPSLCQSLQEYSQTLDTNESDHTHFFVRKDGKAIRPVSVCVSFRTLRRRAGISSPPDVSRQPTVQDLRRTFAVHCIRAWLRRGKDLRDILPILAAYLGHVSVVSTEAYLSVTPERFRRQLSRLTFTAQTK